MVEDILVDVEGVIGNEMQLKHFVYEWGPLSQLTNHLIVYGDKVRSNY